MTSAERLQFQAFRAGPIGCRLAVGDLEAASDELAVWI